MIFTRGFVTRENYWQIPSLVTQKSLFTVTHALFFIYLVKNQSHETKLNDLGDLEQKDPKAFWKRVKKMLAPSENCINSIAHSKWLEHFTGVLNTDASGNIDLQFLEYITSALPSVLTAPVQYYDLLHHIS